MQQKSAAKLGLLGILCSLAVIMPSLSRGQGSQAPSTPTSTPTSTSAPVHEIPDAPSAKKASSGPVQEIQDRSREAATLTEHATTAGLIMARNWESTWIEGVYVPNNLPLIPLTAKQREVIYLRQTLTTPGAYMKRMFGAGIDQASGTPHQWDDGWGGYAERFASREGQFITANTLAALGNAELGYEVRYDRCKCKGLWPRTRHAFMRNLITYDRSEEHWRPQLALYGGAFGGGLLSSTWKPGPRSALAEGGRAMAGQLGWGTLLNFVTEFSREINRKQGVRTQRGTE